MPVWIKNNAAGQPMKGLTAADRSEDDKRSIARDNGADLNEPAAVMPERINIQQPEPAPVVNQVQPAPDSMQNRMNAATAEMARRASEGEKLSPMQGVMAAADVYNSIYDNIRGLTSEYKRLQAKADVYRNDIDDIKTRASIVSKDYRTYKNDPSIKFTKMSDDDWAGMAAAYKARKDTVGQDGADAYLASELGDRMAKKQTLVGKYLIGLRGIGREVASTALTVAGALHYTPDAIADEIGRLFSGEEKDDADNTTALSRIIDSMQDNPLARLADDTRTYNTMDFKDIERRKALDLGPKYKIMSTKEQENSMFDANTLPELIDQYGFTAASMLASGALTKVGSYLFGAAKGSAAKGAIKTAGNIMKARNVIRTIQRAEHVYNAFVVPSLVGSIEGLVEGLSTKKSVEEYGEDAINNYRNRRVDEIAGQITGNGGEVSDETRSMAEAIFDNDADEQAKLADMRKRVESDAINAGANNFLINSAINGALNMTLKAAVQAPRVRTALSKSKLTSWAVKDKPKFKVEGDKVTAASKPMAKAIVSAVKEPVGEGLEEYLQSMSDAFTSGGAENNITKFIDMRADASSAEGIGDMLSGDLGAAFNSMWGTSLSREAAESALYGALGSIVGGPVLRRRDYMSSYGSDGEKRRFYQRREGESRLEAITRLMPWRSGLVQAIRETRSENGAAAKEAEALTGWLRDKNNLNKFDGLVGTNAWAMEMNEAAARGDEYSARNSALGAAVNDAIMLNKLKGTSFYDSFLSNLERSAALEDNTPEAAEAVQAIRRNDGPTFSEMSDAQVLDAIRSNASKMLETMAAVEEGEADVEKYVGDVSDDSKAALIYGELAMRDWNRRSAELAAEIDTAYEGIQDSVPKSGATKIYADAIAEFGTLPNATKKIEEAGHRYETLKGSIAARTKMIDSLSDQGKYKLVIDRAEMKNAKRVMDKYKDYDPLAATDVVLSESEIMGLSPYARGRMLDETNRNSFSDAQRGVIENLVSLGTSHDMGFADKVVDMGRMAKDVENYARQYAALSRDSRFLDMYTAAAMKQRDRAFSKRKLDRVFSIKEYDSFANALDDLFNYGTEEDRAMALNRLGGAEDEFSRRYVRESGENHDITVTMERGSKYRDIDRNEKNIFSVALTYLRKQGIDLSDSESVVRALMEDASEEGTQGSAFRDYFDAVNARMSDSNKMVFTSNGRVTKMMKDVLADYFKAKNEHDEISKPIEDNGENGATNKPSVTPEPTPPPTPPEPTSPVNPNPSSPSGGAGGATLTSDINDMFEDMRASVMRYPGNDVASILNELIDELQKKEPTSSLREVLQSLMPEFRRYTVRGNDGNVLSPGRIAKALGFYLDRKAPYALYSKELKQAVDKLSQIKYDESDYYDSVSSVEKAINGNLANAKDDANRIIDPELKSLVYDAIVGLEPNGYVDLSLPLNASRVLNDFLGRLRVVPKRRPEDPNLTSEFDAAMSNVLRRASSSEGEITDYFKEFRSKLPGIESRLGDAAYLRSYNALPGKANNPPAYDKERLSKAYNFASRKIGAMNDMEMRIILADLITDVQRYEETDDTGADLIYSKLVQMTSAFSVPVSEQLTALLDVLPPGRMWGKVQVAADKAKELEDGRRGGTASVFERLKIQRADDKADKGTEDKGNKAPEPVPVNPAAPKEDGGGSGAAVNPEPEMRRDNLKPAKREAEEQMPSGNIESLDLQYVAKTYSDGALAGFIREYDMENVPAAKLREGTEVFFVTPSGLAKETEERMSYSYSADDIPVVAVIPDADGKMTIDGAKYTPVAIMPSTKNKLKNGVGMKGLRLAVQASGTDTIIRTANGKPYSSKITSSVFSVGRTEYGVTNNQVTDLIADGLEAIDATAFREQLPSKVGATYEKAREDFMRSIELSEPKEGKSRYLTAIIPGSKDRVPVFSQYMVETTNDDGVRITDYVNGKAGSDDLASFNRTFAFIAKDLSKLFNGRNKYDEKGFEYRLNAILRSYFYANDIKTNTVELENVLSDGTLQLGYMGDHIMLPADIDIERKESSVLRLFLFNRNADGKYQLRREKNSARCKFRWQLGLYNMARTIGKWNSGEDLSLSEEQGIELTRTMFDDGLFIVPFKEMIQMRSAMLSIPAPSEAKLPEAARPVQEETKAETKAEEKAGEVKTEEVKAGETKPDESEQKAGTDTEAVKAGETGRKQENEPETEPEVKAVKSAGSLFEGLPKTSYAAKDTSSETEARKAEAGKAEKKAEELDEKVGKEEKKSGESVSFIEEADALLRKGATSEEKRTLARKYAPSLVDALTEKMLNLQFEPYGDVVASFAKTLGNRSYNGVVPDVTLTHELNLANSTIHVILESADGNVDVGQVEIRGERENVAGEVEEIYFNIRSNMEKNTMGENGAAGAAPKVTLSSVSEKAVSDETKDGAEQSAGKDVKPLPSDEELNDEERVARSNTEFIIDLSQPAAKVEHDPSLMWDKLTDEQRESLEDRDIEEEGWNRLDDDSRRQLLDCSM